MGYRRLVPLILAVALVLCGCSHGGGTSGSDRVQDPEEKEDFRSGLGQDPGDKENPGSDLGQDQGDKENPGSDSGQNQDNNDDAAPDQWIAEVGLEEIDVEETVDDSSGSVHVTAQVPNYTELFLEAMGSDDPDRALRQAIDGGEYDTVQYESSVRITSMDEDGSPNTDGLVKSFIEEELIKAINAVTESLEEGE